MKTVAAIHDGLLNSLAAIAAVIIVLFMVGIVYDVTVRTLGFTPPAHTNSLVEYGLLYATLFAAPWLLRKKGHVFVETVTGLLPRTAKLISEKFSYLLCLVVCLIIAYYALDLTISSFQRGDSDQRSFDMPRWLIYAPMPASFLLLAIEFARFLVGPDSMYRDRTGADEGF